MDFRWKCDISDMLYSKSRNLQFSDTISGLHFKLESDKNVSIVQMISIFSKMLKAFRKIFIFRYFRYLYSQ